MVETFASGFAQGFIRARERSEDRAQKEKDKQDALALQEKIYQRNRSDQLTDRDHSEKVAAGIRLDEQKQADARLAETRAYNENQQTKAIAGAKAESDFQDRMKILQTQAATRKAAAAKENELRQTAMTLAGNDPTKAEPMYKLLYGGVSADKISQMDANGEFVRNPNYKEPTRELRVPQAVSMTQPSPGTAPSVNPVTGQEIPVKKRTAAEAMGMTPEDVKRMDSIDPTLSQLPEQEEQTAKNISLDDSPWMYKPKNQVKMRSREEAQLAYLKATDKDNPDPAQARVAKQELDAYSSIKTQEAMEIAQAKAKAEGLGTETYFNIDANGRVLGQFVGRRDEKGQIWDISNTDDQNPQGRIVTGRTRMMGKDDINDYNAMVRNYQKPAADFDAAQTNFIGGMRSTQRMAQILYNNPHANSYVSKGLGIVADLQGEAQALMSSVNNLQTSISKEQDPARLEALIAKQASEVEKLTNMDVLGDKNRSEVVAAAQFTALKLSAANQLAQAMATDGKVSNVDRQMALDIIGNNSDPNQLLPKLMETMQDGYVRLRSQEDTLNNNTEVGNYEQRFGLKTGLRPTRMEDKIVRMGGANADQLRSFYKNLESGFQSGVALAATPDGLIVPKGDPRTGQVEQPKAQEVQYTDFSTLPANQQKEAVDMLKSNPALKDQFETTFGPGSAARILGGK